MRNYSEYFDLLKEELLVEDIAAVMKNYPNIPQDTFMKAIALDPTYKEGSNSVGKYGKWILNLINKNKLKEEDFYKVPRALTEFEQKRANFTNKDIGQFKSLPDLVRALDEVGEVELSHAQQVRANQKARKNSDLNNEAEKVFSGDGYDIWVPKTYAAECKLGEGSHWCTASTESDYYYNYYKETYGGNYYVLIGDETINTKDKYQIHFESNQFMDYYDNPIDLPNFFSTHKSIAEFFRPIRLKILGLPEDAKDEDTISVTFAGKEITQLFEGYDSRADRNWRDESLSGESILKILDFDMWEWFDDPSYSGYDLKDALNVANEENIKEILKIAQVESLDDLEDSERFDDIDTALKISYADASSVGAMDECYKDVMNAMESHGMYYDGDNMTFTFKVKDILDSSVDSETLYGDPYFGDFKKDFVLAYLIENMSIYEPRYGWYGFSESAFNERLSDELYNL